MSFLLPKLTSKKEVDQAIKSTAEKVLVLRFGRDEDPVCLQLDDIVSFKEAALVRSSSVAVSTLKRNRLTVDHYTVCKSQSSPCPDLRPKWTVTSVLTPSPLAPVKAHFPEQAWKE